jgi:4-carboxymuconolactone decarboxylase
MSKSDSYQTGWEAMHAVHDRIADATIESLASIAPDLGDLIVSFVYGEVFSRPGLDAKTRQICIVSMLAAMGGQTAPELKAHIRGALNVGWTREEIVEVLMMTAVYAGFPAAINALHTAKKAFHDWEKDGPE